MLSWGGASWYGLPPHAQLASGVKKVYFNGFGGAALKEDGTVYAWGDQWWGGSTAPVVSDLVHVVEIFYNLKTFAAVTTGKVVLWGDAASVDTPTRAALDSGVVKVFGWDRTSPERQYVPVPLITGHSPKYKANNGFAFAVTSASGSVHTWGEAPHGGDSSAVQHLLQSGIAKVVPSRFAFAALADNGSVTVWGVGVSAAEDLIDPVQELVVNEAAFAGISSGRLVAFGSRHNGGVVDDDARCLVPPCPANVEVITASACAFAALMTGGSVYSWGSKHCGADIPTAVYTNLVSVTKVVATREALAALTTTGRVLTLGAVGTGDSSSVSNQLQSGVLNLNATRSTFIAFKQNAGIVVWGYHAYGGDTSAVASQITSVVTFVAHTATVMAALKVGGSVVTWGDAAGGGDSSAVHAQLVNIRRIHANSKAFAAVTST